MPSIPYSKKLSRLRKRRCRLVRLPTKKRVPWYSLIIQKIHTFFTLIILFLRILRSFFRIKPRKQNEKPGFDISKLKAPFAIDIGGTMSKFVFLDFETKETKKLYLKKIGKELNTENIDDETLSTINIPTCIKIHPVKPFTFKNTNPSVLKESVSKEFAEEGFSMKFLEFPSSRIECFIDFIKENKLQERFGRGINEIFATGGGAYKYAKLLEDFSGIKLKQVDEMKSLVHGLNYLIMTEGVGDFFMFNEKHEQEKVVLDQNIYPYILVQIGSGVSFILVTSPNKFKRVSGSSIGGGTFAGLCRLICKDTSFESWVDASQKGNNEAVDLLVGDIYGQDYSEHGLSANVIASSFGKVATSTMNNNDEIKDNFFKGDAIRSLAYMISNNITLIATLNAQKYKVKTVLFSGGFIRDNPFVWNKLRFGMKYCSAYNGISPEIRTIFVKHDNILGALGALLYGSVSYE